jgi:hypothetical protein
MCKIIVARARARVRREKEADALARRAGYMTGMTE